MEDKRILGKLVIDIGDKPLELDVLSGILDRSYSCFDYNTHTEKNIDGYNLSVDVSNLGKEALKDLESVVNSLNKFKVMLSLYGEEKQGNAILSQNMGLCGVTLDVELYS